MIKNAHKKAVKKTTINAGMCFMVIALTIPVLS